MFYLILFSITIYPIQILAEALDSKIKSIYVTNISSSEVDKKLLIKTQSLINIELLNQSKNKLKIIDDDMAILLRKRLEQVQKMGCDDSKCLIMIAESLDTDFILQTTMFYESKDKITIIFKKSKFDKENLNMILDVEVTKSFYISQLNFYITELIQKLLYKDYIINDKNAPPVLDEGFNIGQISKTEIKPLSSFKLETMQDERLNEILLLLKKSEREAEKAYKKNDYLKAFKDYERIIITINTKLSEDDRKQISQYIISLNKNKQSALYLHSMQSTEGIDNSLKNEINLNSSIYQSYINKYEFVFQEYLSLNENISNKELLGIIESRISKLRLASFKLKEIEIDEIYNKFQFNEAYIQYESLYRDVQKFDLKEDKNYKNEIYNKMKITKETGNNNLFNKVRNFCDNAYKLNIKLSLNLSSEETYPGDLKKERDNSIQEASILIKNNTMFLNDSIQKYYDGIYKTIYGKTEKEFYKEEFEIKEKKRKEELSRQKEIEYERRSFYNRIDKLYPGLGGTFYGDEGSILKLLTFTSLLGSMVSLQNSYNQKYSDYNSTNDLYLGLAIISPNSLNVSFFASGELQKIRKDMVSITDSYSLLTLITLSWYYLNITSDSNSYNRYGFNLYHEREKNYTHTESRIDDIYKFNYTIGF